MEGIYEQKSLSVFLCLALCTSALSGCKSDKADTTKEDNTSYVESVPAVTNNDKTASSSVENVASAGTNTGDIDEDEPTGNSGDFGLSKKDLPALEFMRACLKKDLSALRTFLPWEDTTFITDADIDWLMARSEFSDVYDTAEGADADSLIRSAEVSKSTSETRLVTFSLSGASTASVLLRLNDDNDWVVDPKFSTDYYTENYKVLLPFAKCRFNGIEITDAYITGNDDNLRCEYTLPVVVRRHTTEEVDAGELGTLVRDVSDPRPNSENDNVAFKPNFVLTITPEQESELCKAIEVQINAMMDAAETAYYGDKTSFNLDDWVSTGINNTDYANLKGEGWELVSDENKTSDEIDPRLKKLEDLLKGDD